ncbi:MAG: cyclic nucleotide-binding domain-containing protein [Elusimicrobia bacterium]|nr:cyclic nucleotide-binding domain-containing protein [Elusimicrobiota bacterium]
MTIWNRLVRRIAVDPEFERRKKSLSQIPILQGLNATQLARVLSMLYHRTYQEGEAIFNEGEIGRALFIIETGKVALTKKDVQGRSQHLATLESGDFFGEMALLEEMPRSAAAVAREQSSLFLMYKSSLDAFVLVHPDIGALISSALAKLMSGRVRMLSEKLSSTEQNGKTP